MQNCTINVKNNIKTKAGVFKRQIEYTRGDGAAVKLIA